MSEKRVRRARAPKAANAALEFERVTSADGSTKTRLRVRIAAVGITIASIAAVAKLLL